MERLFAALAFGFFFFGVVIAGVLIQAGFKTVGGIVGIAWLLVVLWAVFTDGGGDSHGMPDGGGY